MNATSYAMKKVVLFRSVSEEYQKVFNENNYEPIFIPPLEFLFVNSQILNEELQSSDYDGLILTSPRAIEALSHCWEPSKFVSWNTKKVYTVGDSSYNKIKQLLGLEATGMASGNAANLAEVIVGESNTKSRFFFPCGNLSSETLPNILHEKGIVVNAMTVYETKENENLRSALMQLDTLGDILCGMVFFSPSGCEYIHRQLQTFANSLSNLPHFAIGNTTAHKIENLGLDIAGVATKPKAECIVESICSYLTTSANAR